MALDDKRAKAFERMVRDMRDNIAGHVEQGGWDVVRMALIAHGQAEAVVKAFERQQVSNWELLNLAQICIHAAIEMEMERETSPRVIEGASPLGPSRGGDA